MKLHVNIEVTTLPDVDLVLRVIVGFQVPVLGVLLYQCAPVVYDHAQVHKSTEYALFQAF